MRLHTGIVVLASLVGLSAHATGQCELARLYPGAPVNGIGGTATMEDGVVALSGRPNRVSLFERAPGGWSEVANFACPGDFLFETIRVAACRDFVVAGMVESPFSVITGTAFVFERQNGWTQPFQLSGSDVQAFYTFGSGLAVDGDTIVVGASMILTDTICGPGKAYVFERGGPGWVETGNFAPHGYTNTMDGYGVRLDVHGDTVVIGAPGDDQLHPGAGAVYVYERGASGWGEVAKLFASNAAPRNGFGKAVAVEGTTLLAGSDEAVYWFERDDELGWQEQQILVASDARLDDRFGTAVALEGDRAVVGAPWVDGVHTDVGAIYVFDRRAGRWYERTKIVADEAGRMFGSTVALDSNQVLWTPSYDPDHARVHSLGLGNYTTYCTLTPNSTGMPATIFAEGCDSVLAGALTLHAENAPPGRPGLFLYAASRQEVPFADGNLCLTAPLHRLPSAVVDGAGRMSTAIDFQGPEAQFLTPGQTWYFQAYFRDDPGFGTGANLSDALALRLTP